MSALEDERAYHLWIGRKISTLRRARLDCGHPKVDAVYFHIGCDRLSCSEDSAGADHDCAAYGGAKDKSGSEKRPETVQADAPVPMVQCDTTPWVSFADVAAGPSAGGDPATVDLRRRVQDGTAPTPGVDRVHDAFRAEVIRQGLREYSVDGVRYVVEDERLDLFNAQPIRDISGFVNGARPRPFLAAALDAERDVFADRVSAALDAALESAQVATAKSKNDHVPWWRRMLPGGKR